MHAGYSLYRGADKLPLRETPQSDYQALSVLPDMQYFLLRTPFRFHDNASGRKLVNFLRRLREGALEDSDWEELNARALGTGGIAPLHEVVDRVRILALRHQVIEQVTDTVVRAQARAAGKQLLWWRALDVGRGHDGPMRSANCQARGYFYDGMQAICSQTVSAKHGVVNNAPVVMHAIALHPNEPARDLTDAAVELRYMPETVFGRVPDGQFLLPDCEPGIVPLAPVEVTVRSKRMRKNFPYYPATAMTDYASQGASFEADACIVLDLSRPEKGPLSFFSINVGTSRYREFAHIKLLRPLWIDGDPLDKEYALAFYGYCGVPPRDAYAAMWRLENAGATQEAYDAALAEFDVRAKAKRDRFETVKRARERRRANRA